MSEEKKQDQANLVEEGNLDDVAGGALHALVLLGLLHGEHHVGVGLRGIGLAFVIYMSVIVPSFLKICNCCHTYTCLSIACELIDA